MSLISRCSGCVSRRGTAAVLGSDVKLPRQALPKYYRFLLVSFPPRHGPVRPGHLSRYMRE
jgi:hypothetical protein